jgi:NAD(P)-dependent dehydrogenase (short-subunit alcohol dehydrogenase family)
VRDFGGLDILVNNAGIIYRKLVEETTVAEWDEMMNVNARAAFLFSQAAMPPLRASPYPVILNIASRAGVRGTRRGAVYAASKGAMVQLTRSMALDHAREQIRIIAICPADVDTPMIASEAEQSGQTHAERLADLPHYYPLGRIGTPEEIARAAVFLSSDDCTFITGATFVIDGGYSA